MADTDELATLRADARYAQERFHLYRAKSYGMHATRPERLRELERRANETLERLRFAEREAGLKSRGASGPAAPRSGA